LPDFAPLHIILIDVVIATARSLPSGAAVFRSPAILQCIATCWM